LYEKSFPWLQHDGTVTDSEINPDLLVKRTDGFFDIYDFKLAKTERARLTKGERKRRRFVDYVAEGVHQLANYREYFTYPKNAEFAERKFGVKIKEPKLVLIAGHAENIVRDEVLQACRPYHDVHLVDYDTLATMFISPKPVSHAALQAESGR
jgi:hypothetical protein